MSVAVAVALLRHVSPTKERIVSEFKRYTTALERVEDAEEIRHSTGGADLLRKIYESMEGRRIDVELSEDESELLRFLSET